MYCARTGKHQAPRRQAQISDVATLLRRRPSRLASSGRNTRATGFVRWPLYRSVMRMCTACTAKHCSRAANNCIGALPARLIRAQKPAGDPSRRASPCSFPIDTHTHLNPLRSRRLSGCSIFSGENALSGRCHRRALDGAHHKGIHRLAGARGEVGEIETRFSAEVYRRAVVHTGSTKQAARRVLREAFATWKTV